jgi:hypothetical protein
MTFKEKLAIGTVLMVVGYSLIIITIAVLQGLLYGVCP